MKKIILLLLSSAIIPVTDAQRIVPAAPQHSSEVISGGTIHVGDGHVIENGAVAFDNGKITYVGSVKDIPAGYANIIDAKGKDVYPGLIAPLTDLGLNEIELDRSTNDFAETGTFNPGTRSLIAYNTDSKSIPTVRSNGILLAQVAPLGGTISGSSSIMQLDAWNWEDAQYQPDDGIHLNWPSFFRFQPADNGGSVSPNDDYEKQVQEIRKYFSEARSYNAGESHSDRNINFEALKGVFDHSKTLFIHSDYVREIVNAIQFARDFNIHVVIAGGRDSYMCTDLLKENNIAVILGNVHGLPGGEDVKVDIPYSTAAMLQKAGVMYCLSIFGFWQQRNLPFMAGTTVAYGVSKEDALKSITSNAAKIMNIENRTGTLEPGKDANIIISSGDILDMRTNNIERAFIGGRDISLDNSQKQLYEIYMKKYGLK